MSIRALLPRPGRIKWVGDTERSRVLLARRGQGLGCSHHARRVKNVWGKGHVVLLGHIPGVACGCDQIREGVMWPASTSMSCGGGV